jgi:hypothetical protein
MSSFDTISDYEEVSSRLSESRQRLKLLSDRFSSSSFMKAAKASLKSESIYTLRAKLVSISKRLESGTIIYIVELEDILLNRNQRTKRNS